MDILKDIVYPQSANHVLLLKYVLFLTLVILLPYLGVLIGSLFFSLVHYGKGKRDSNKFHLKFAKDLIDLVTINKGMSITLGLVPVLSLMFAFAQLFLSSNVNFTEDLFFTVILFAITLFYIYIYKYSFSLRNIFNLVSNSELDVKAVAEFESFKNSNSKVLQKTGSIGFVLLLIVSYLIISVLQFSLDTSKWIESANLTDLIFSTSSLLYFLFFLSFSISLTSIVVLYKFLRKEKVVTTNQYINYVKNFVIKTGFIFTFIQPLLYVLTVINSPKSSLSFEDFIIIPFILGVMLLISIVLYNIYKNNKFGLSGSGMFLFFLLTTLIVFKDQVAFDTATQLQVMKIEKEHLTHVAEIKEEAGVQVIVEINGEDIYNAKCIACHRFDSQLVGPAYNEVLPKYDGKRDQLVDFILNPRKINPELPAMPSQGLKPKEAEAIADYIVKIYEDSKK